MKILSLFDGISVARVALERAEIPVEAYYASEIDRYAMQVSVKNYPDIVQLGDVSKLGKENSYPKELLEGVDLIVGGFPCQSYSIAGNRKGLDDPRGQLVYEFFRIIKELKPRFLIAENVSSMKKELQEKFRKEFELAMGEPVNITEINASLVSAQNRKRIFFTNILNVTQPEDRGILLKDILEENVDEKYAVLLKNGDEKLKSNTVRTSGRGSGIDDKHNWDTIRIGQIGKGGQGERIYSPEGKSVGLSALGGGRGAKTGLYAVAQRGRNIVDGKRKDILGAKTEQRIEVGQSDKGHTITSVQKDSMVMNNMQIRKLTPIECLRLQSLPDNYFDVEGLSNNQKYKCAGNAFNCNVVAHILSSLDKPLPTNPIELTEKS